MSMIALSAKQKQNRFKAQIAKIALRRRLYGLNDGMNKVTILVHLKYISLGD